jgi:hypothetical protein
MLILARNEAFGARGAMASLQRGRSKGARHLATEYFGPATRWPIKGGLATRSIYSRGNAGAAKKTRGVGARRAAELPPNSTVAVNPAKCPKRSIPQIAPARLGV